MAQEPGWQTVGRSAAVRQGVAALPRQVSGVRLAGLLLGTALTFYVVASIWLNSALNRPGTPPSEGTLRFAAWAFERSGPGLSVAVRAAYPPLGVWIVIIVAMLASSRIAVAPKMRIGNKLGEAGRLNRQALANFRSQCHQQGFAGLQNPYRVKMKIGFGVTAMLALMTTGAAHLIAGPHRPGVGMFVAFFVGLLGALAFCMLWPSPNAPSYAVDENGNIWPVAIAPVRAPAIPPAPAPPVPPQPVWRPPAPNARPASSAPLPREAEPARGSVAVETRSVRQARFCPDCGHQRDPGDHFCPGCGHALTRLEDCP